MRIRFLLRGAFLYLILACTIARFSLASDSHSFASHIYWVSAQINRAELDGGNIVEVTDIPSSGFSGLLVDRASELIYLVDGTRLRSFDLDGGNEQTVFTFPRVFENGEMALDHLRDQIYLTDSRHNAIWRIDRDGSNPIELIHSPNTPGGFPQVDNISLDVVNDKIYWSSWPNFDRVQFNRSNLDGTNIETLFTFRGPVGDFDIDVNAGHLYWTVFGLEEGSGGVLRSNLDGTDQQLLAGGLFGTTGIALDLTRGKLYFSDHWSAGPVDYDGRIFSANLDGSDLQTLINLGPLDSAKPYWLSLDLLSIPEPTTIHLAVPLAVMLILKKRLLASRN